MDKQSVILLVVAGYLLICLGIGIWASRRTRSAADFFVAGKTIGVVVLGIAAFSTTLSGFAFIGGPGLVYKLGTTSLWMCVPAGFGFIWGGMAVAKRMRVFAELYDVMTLPDIVDVRFGCRWCRLAAASSVLLGVIAYLGVQITAIGVVAESFFEIDGNWAMIIGVAVILFYSVAGGIIAGLYTDLFQGMIMAVASVAVTYVAISAAGEGRFVEGPGNITDALLASDQAAAAGPWGLAGPMLCLSWLFLFTFGSAGQPHVITKYLMSRTVRDTRMGMVLAGGAYVASSLLWISVGFSAKYLVLTEQLPAPVNENQVTPDFLLSSFVPNWLAGIVFGGVLAAIMSTSDSFLNLGAAVFVHDIPRAIRGRSAQNELTVARVATVLIALGATAFSVWAQELVAILGIFSWGTFAAALAPLVVIGLNWPRATRQGALVSILLGITAHLTLEFLARYPSKEEPLYKLPMGVDAGCTALLISCLAFVVVSYLTRPQLISERLKTAIET